MNRLSKGLACSACIVVGLGCDRGEVLSGTAGSNLPGTSSEAVTGGICPGPATVQGIDVSEFQDSVDWATVKSSGRVFGITRIGDGDYEDPTFAANWSGIKAAGLVRGAYQFFEPGENAVEQANIVISKVGKLGAGDLPVMLDMEVTGGQSAGTIVSQIQQWASTVEAGTGKKPFIYTGAYFWDDNVGSTAFSSYVLNVAWYGTNCPGVPNAWASEGWKFHQYSSSGSVPGVQKNPTDLDVFNGDLAALEAFAGAQSNCGATPAIPKAPATCGAIAPGEGLGPGDSVSSCDGRFTLVMQGDGNLVQYSLGVPLWWSGTNGRGGYVAAMQTDGNFVVYSKDACPLWYSATNGHPGTSLAEQDDGNVVLYDGPPLWSSGTGGIPPKPTTCGTMTPGEGLAPGEALTSCDGQHELVMQGDGNFVLYHHGVATWFTSTVGSPYRFAVMQGDGNLVVYAHGGQPAWDSRTNGHPGAYLAVQNDGNVVVYDDGKALWNSGTEGR
jgi:GH25 family lysozyme M1 (1,4-beta-N-acetylmuramidase)